MYMWKKIKVIAMFEDGYTVEEVKQLMIVEEEVVERLYDLYIRCKLIQQATDSR